MSSQDWEHVLRDLPNVATPVRQSPTRETWRFEHAGRAYFLHFYPAGTSRLSRGPATKEFAALKTLQTLGLDAVRPVALLSGLRFADRKGDAVLLSAVEPAQRLDALSAAGRKVRENVIAWLEQLADAGLGHDDLRPSSFLIVDDRALLADAVGIVKGGLTREHLLRFAHAAGASLSRADRLRGWRRLVPAGDVPPRDRHQARRFRRDLAGEEVEPLMVREWRGRFLAAGHAAEWSPASRVRITADDWQREWPKLVAAMRRDEMHVMKRDGSGDVLSGKVTLGGAVVDVVLKRPRNKFWYRYVLDAFRPSRAWRMWAKARWLLVRGVPVERPLVMLERRVSEYTVEAIAVFERVPGTTMEHVDLDTMPPAKRETLLRRCGRLLRRLDDTGLAHTDGKSSNWVVFDSPTRGPMPVAIDVYGVRQLNPWSSLLGLHRLLRAMKKHPQYTPTDSKAICQGFAPFSPLMPEAGGAN